MVTLFRLNNNIDEDFLRQEVFSRVYGSKEPNEIEKIKGKFESCLDIIKVLKNCVFI